LGKNILEEGGKAFVITERTGLSRDERREVGGCRNRKKRREGTELEQIKRVGS
jgi:hypothetical protein